MENNVQVQKTADISSLVCVVIVSLSALTAYNLGEKFNHYILFDATIFIISLVMLILTFAVFRKVMAGLYKSISNSAISKQVQSNCSQEVSSDNSITETQPVILEQMPDSLEKYESILVEEQLKEVKRKRDTMIAIREYVVEKDLEISVKREYQHVIPQHRVSCRKSGDRLPANPFNERIKTQFSIFKTFGLEYRRTAWSLPSRQGCIHQIIFPIRIAKR